MATMNMVQAINSAQEVMLERDKNVVLFGQDIGYFGGVFNCTEGLQKKFGEQRVFGQLLESDDGVREVYDRSVLGLEIGDHASVVSSGKPRSSLDG